MVQALDINGQIVQDADRLDAIGAFGIVRTLQYGFDRKRELYNPISCHRLLPLKQLIMPLKAQRSIIFMKNSFRFLKACILKKPSNSQGRVITS
jgi:HD superfamily phosphodiesterase